jgi:hypothetical protein
MSLQQKWQFLQRVTQDLDEEFRDIEEALQKRFLPSLFGDDITDDVPRHITCLPVKKCGLATYSKPNGNSGYQLDGFHGNLWALDFGDAREGAVQFD